METRSLLIVDDSEEFLTMLEHVLSPLAQLQHWSLLHATDGVTALHLLDVHHDVAVLITDIHMPTLSGLELIEQCSTVHPTVQCIAVSASDDSKTIRAALRAGACDYLVKPITIDELEDALDRALARHIALCQTITTRNQLLRIEQELAIAADIQRNMIPPPLFHDASKRVRLAAELLPARSVAGDFYDYWMVAPDVLAFCIGDVSGKGISAALWMAVARTLLRSHLENTTLLPIALAAVNRALANDNLHAYFVTAIVGMLHLNTGHLTLCSAAHPPPLRQCLGGTIAQVTMPPNMPLGALDSSTYVHTTLQLESGDRILFYTDGVSESLSTRGHDGTLSLMETLHQFNQCTTEAVTHQLITKIQEHYTAVNEFPDDMTIVVLDYNRMNSNTNFVQYNRESISVECT